MARTDLSALLLAAKTAEIWRKEEVKTLTTSGSYDEAPGAAQIHRNSQQHPESFRDKIALKVSQIQFGKKDLQPEARPCWQTLNLFRAAEDVFY